jgi:hypothetical protein
MFKEQEGDHPGPWLVTTLSYRLQAAIFTMCELTATMCGRAVLPLDSSPKRCLSRQPSAQGAMAACIQQRSGTYFTADGQ